MESTQTQPDKLKTARILWAIVVINVAMVIIFSLILPENPNPPNEGGILFAWVLLAMMPIDIVIQVAFYKFFMGKGQEYTLGGSFIISMLAAAIALYGMIMTLLNETMRQLGLIMALGFSVIALGLGWIFTTNLFERYPQSL